MQKFDILISILTLPEVEFLIPIAKRFQEHGYRVGFILFHEAGRALLKEAKIPFFNMHELSQAVPVGPLGGDEADRLRESFGVENIRHLFMHEKLGYNRNNEELLLQKAARFLKVLDGIFSETGPRCVIQELGGFCANQCVYYAAKKNSIDHVFYEPAAYPRRIVFSLNSYYCDIPESIMSGPVPEETIKRVTEYRNRYLDEANVLIPFKDRSSFSDMRLSKIFNAENFRKLKRKLGHKYLSGQREEYDQIGWVVKFNFKKLFNRFRQGSHYTDPDYSDRYVYFPFHVPHDIQLSTRSRAFYFQEGFVDHLSRAVPYGYKLYLKEHPAAIGAHSYPMIKNILRLHDNVRLISPMVNSSELIKNADLVVTINSKVGFEAVMHGKPVMVTGETFYKGKGVTYDVKDLKEMDSTINKALGSEPPSEEKIMDFMARVYLWSYPSELFLMEEDNVEISCRSFCTYLTEEVLKETGRAAREVQ